MEDVKAIAESTISYIVEDDIESLKMVMSTSGDKELWHRVFRYELKIEDMIEVGGLLQYDIVVPKLVLWGTQTISPYHVAALRGIDDVLRVCVRQLGVRVDVKLSNGTTALHVACFAGQIDATKMLIDELQADVNATDELVFLFS
jgi:Ankyrin repeats (3 copies)